MTNEERADAILATVRKANLPHPSDLEMRVVGWVVPEELAGLSDALFALDVIVKRAAQEWQDISTAPKDGKTVYGENWKTGQRGLVHLNDHGEWEIVDGMSNLPTGIGFYPTHWLPLPASPPYPAQPAALIADHRTAE